MRSRKFTRQASGQTLVLQEDSTATCMCLQIAKDWAGFAYISDGAGKIGGTKGKREQALVLGQGDTISATTDNAEGMR